jgi:hypothetical protein
MVKAVELKWNYEEGVLTVTTDRLGTVNKPVFL